MSLGCNVSTRLGQQLLDPRILSTSVHIWTDLDYDRAVINDDVLYRAKRWPIDIYLSPAEGSILTGTLFHFTLNSQLELRFVTPTVEIDGVSESLDEKFWGLDMVGYQHESISDQILQICQHITYFYAEPVVNYQQRGRQQTVYYLGEFRDQVYDISQQTLIKRVERGITPWDQDHVVMIAQIAQYISQFAIYNTPDCEAKRGFSI